MGFHDGAQGLFDLFGLSAEGPGVDTDLREQAVERFDQGRSGAVVRKTPGHPSADEENRHGDGSTDSLNEERPGNSSDHTVLEDTGLGGFESFQNAGFLARISHPDLLRGKLSGDRALRGFLLFFAGRVRDDPFESHDHPRFVALRGVEDRPGDRIGLRRAGGKLRKDQAEVAPPVDTNRGVHLTALDDRDRRKVGGFESANPGEPQGADHVMTGHRGGEARAREGGHHDRPFPEVLGCRCLLSPREFHGPDSAWAETPVPIEGDGSSRAQPPSTRPHSDADVGLPLRDLVVAQELPWDSLAGRTLAVDGYNAVYQFLATLRQRDGQLFSDPEGRVTSHLMGVFYRTTSLLREGVLPIWVFDGKPPERKTGTIRQRIAAKEKAEEQWQQALAAGDLETARKKAAQTSRLTRPMVEELRQLLTALGVPSVQAPGEGEAQAAVMASKGAVWASGSEDYDTLLFGSPRLIRGLAARGRGGTSPGAQLIDRNELLANLGISEDELILLGIVIGTDFNDGVRGYGPKKALKLVQEHLGFRATIEKVGIAPDEAEEVAEIFRHPNSIDVPPPSFGPVDETAVRSLLVDVHGFSEERVRAAIARARQRPRVSSSPQEARGHQTLLETFGGPSQP